MVIASAVPVQHIVAVAVAEPLPPEMVRVGAAVSGAPLPVQRTAVTEPEPVRVAATLALVMMPKFGSYGLGSTVMLGAVE